MARLVPQGNQSGLLVAPAGRLAPPELTLSRVSDVSAGMTLERHQLDHQQCLRMASGLVFGVGIVSWKWCEATAREDRFLTQRTWEPDAGLPRAVRRRDCAARKTRKVLPEKHHARPTAFPERPAQNRLLK